MTTKSRIELAVGIFIVIGLFILVSFVFFIKDFQIIKPGYNFNIIFGFANGVKVGAPVRLAGVDVGEVKDIDVISNYSAAATTVKVKVWVNKYVCVPQDSQVWINTLGLLGEKYIEIIPGKNYKLMVGSGHDISGSDPVPIDEITKEAKKIVAKLEDTLNGFNELLEKVKKGEGSLGKLIYDDSMYNNINELVAKLNSGQGTIGKLISDDAIYKNFEELSEDIKRHPWKLLFKTNDVKEKK